ncbi:MAG: signal peptidase II, partial [Muribaculaceae bacterium]
VVDMLYFPLVEWDWPMWMPWVGGEHFIFFQPIFNIADAALSVATIVIILFYSKTLAKTSEGKHSEKEQIEQ